MNTKENMMNKAYTQEEIEALHIVSGIPEEGWKHDLELMPLKDLLLKAYRGFFSPNSKKTVIVDTSLINKDKHEEISERSLNNISTLKKALSRLKCRAKNVTPQKPMKFTGKYSLTPMFSFCYNQKKIRSPHHLLSSNAFTIQLFSLECNSKYMFAEKVDKVWVDEKEDGNIMFYRQRSFVFFDEWEEIT